MPRDASRSRSPSTAVADPRVRCALLPLCTHPKQDLATPMKVTETAAARLRKRAQRERERAEQHRKTGAEELLIGFPWNDGTKVETESIDVHFVRLPIEMVDRGGHPLQRG